MLTGPFGPGIQPKGLMAKRHRAYLKKLRAAAPWLKKSGWVDQIQRRIKLAFIAGYKAGEMDEFERLVTNSTDDPSDRKEE